MPGSTPHQRLHIRCLLVELDIDTLFVSEALLRHCRSAGITTWTPGQRLDDVLRALDGDKARSLAKALLKPDEVAA